MEKTAAGGEFLHKRIFKFHIVIISMKTSITSVPCVKVYIYKTSSWFSMNL